MKKGVILS